MNQDIVNQKRIAIFQKWAALDEKMRGLYGTKVSQMLNSFRTSNYTVNKNYQELSTAINSYEANTKILNPEKQEERMLFFREFS
jgi:phage baseplate assembly protein W